MKVVVSDTSPIRALAHLSRLDLLRDVFGEVLIPPAVVLELQNPHARVDVEKVLSLPFVRVQSPRDLSRVREFRAVLDAGESEALALALESPGSIVLVDDAEARATAEQMGLEVVGALGILLRGKRGGLVQAVGPLMDRLQKELRFFISASVRQDVLRRAGE